MREAIIRNITNHQASQLLHNKFVVVLGDSIQRSVYKDMVLLLQKDSYLTLPQLKSKGELSFAQDCLVEGGRLGHMTNGTEYREVRQYRSGHHLVRFYFITQVFSRYMESILADFKQELKPDLVIVNSCVWDVSRYNRKWVPEYKENLNKFFSELKAILPAESLVVWNMTMPLGKKIVGGFLIPQIQDVGPMLRHDVIEANFYGATLANAYGLDVLDLHFLFRFSLHHRMKDGVHWNAVTHRQITCLLLAHAAQAWGVKLPKPPVMVPHKDVHQLEIPKHSMFQLDHTDQSKVWLLNYSQTPYQSGYGSAGYRTESADYRDNYDRRYGNPPMEPHNFNYKGLPWHQEQQYDGFQPHFCKDSFSTLAQFSDGYLSFDSVEQNNGGNSSLLPPNVRPGFAAPSWPVSNFVMKQKPRKRKYNPYTRKNPNPVSR